ncbi:hypothetical protein BKA64DRAFT_702871 [Cadophora sp. MPI-SDFR-AT-0126]|nr:hypothetical protein BKA64DRAFT_702871 [Leotiomycetes sp. MPI-SDFR-AT-0126]
MADEVRLRAACDRCHSQKIKCPRNEGSETCDRCMKARTPCIFSPFRQKKPPEEDADEEVHTVVMTPHPLGRTPDVQFDVVGLGGQKRKRLDQDNSSSSTAPPIDAEDTPVQIVNLDNDPLGLDWMPNSFPDSEGFTADNPFNNFNFGNAIQYPPLDFNILDPENTDVVADTNEVQYRRNVNPDRALQGTSNLLLGPNFGQPKPNANPRGNLQYTWPYGVREPEPDSAKTFVRKLSQLNVDLSDHKATLPPLSVHDDLPPELDVACPQSTEYVLEDTFRLTQSLIEIYPSFLHLFINPTPSSKSTTPDSDFLSTGMFENDGEGSSSSTATSNISSCAKQPLDHASILLLISCHLRVIDIYDTLFKHMDACISQRGMAKNARQAALSAPTLSIGNYIPPPSSAVPMQMLLLVQFASQLYNYAIDLASEIPCPQDVLNSGGQTDSALVLTKAAAENIKDRAGDMSQRLSDLRTEMLSSGLLA